MFIVYESRKRTCQSSSGIVFFSWYLFCFLYYEDENFPEAFPSFMERKADNY